MEFVTLRRAGGSLVLTIPKTHVRALGLSAGERIGVSVDEGKLVVDPSAGGRPSYRLEDLLAQCDPAAPLSEEDEAWLADRPKGAEAI
jgi:antitoxin ChpS